MDKNSWVEVKAV